MRIDGEDRLRELEAQTILVLVRGFERFGHAPPGQGVLLVGFWPEDAPYSVREVWDEWYMGDEEPEEVGRVRAAVIDTLGLRFKPGDLEGISITRRPGSDRITPEDLVCLFDGCVHSPSVLRAIPLCSLEDLRGEEGPG